MKWWEKTVEYKFIGICLSQKVLKLAPLDGNEERAGDTILATNNKWVLIEFKKDEDSINSEKKKFRDYNNALLALIDRDQHHFIVFGHGEETEEGLVLKIKARTYFSEISSNAIKDMLEKGEDLDNFKAYLQEFISYKKSTEGTVGSGGDGLNVEDYSLVAAVNNEGEIIECQSLSEFANQELNMDLGLEQIIEPDYPSFSGPTL